MSETMPETKPTGTVHEPPTPVAAWLREGLRKAGWSAYQLRKATGYSPGFFTRSLNGEIKSPRAPKIRRMGRVLALNWTDDPAEQQRYIDEGLLAAGHAPSYLRPPTFAPNETWSEEEKAEDLRVKAEAVKKRAQMDGDAALETHAEEVAQTWQAVEEGVREGKGTAKSHPIGTATVEMKDASHLLPGSFAITIMLHPSQSFSGGYDLKVNPPLWGSVPPGWVRPSRRSRRKRYASTF